MAVNVKIVVKNNNVDFALKLLKKKIKDFKTLVDYQETLAFEKPSVKKRKKRIDAIRRKDYESKLNKENF